MIIVVGSGLLNSDMTTGIGKGKLRIKTWRWTGSANAVPAQDMYNVPKKIGYGISIIYTYKCFCFKNSFWLVLMDEINGKLFIVIIISNSINHIKGIIFNQVKFIQIYSPKSGWH